MIETTTDVFYTSFEFIVRYASRCVIIKQKKIRIMRLEYCNNKILYDYVVFHGRF